MVQDQAGQEAVVKLITEQYQRIRPIEEEWGIRYAEADMRPRVEHFHDAVRALVGGTGDVGRGGRLSVEYLAYDLAQLRGIQDKPIGAINRMTQQSEAGAVVPVGAPAARRTPDSKTRMELSALYVFYTLLYSALFAQVAGDGFKERSEQAESQMDDLVRIQQVLAQLVKGQITAREAEGELMHVERDDLREAMAAMVRKGSFSPADMMKAQGMISTIRQGLSQEKKTIEQAHMHYATAQLAIYEQSRDAVKKMAGQGLNLAGKFLEAATQGVGQGRGR